MFALAAAAAEQAAVGSDGSSADGAAVPATNGVAAEVVE
jgi:hypothetical protein